MLAIKCEQLDERHKVNELQAEDLRESLKERAGLREVVERGQADRIGFRMGQIPFLTIPLRT